MSAADKGQPIIVSDMRPRPGLVIEYESTIDGVGADDQTMHTITRITYDEPPRDVASQVIERALAYIFTE